MSSGLPAQLSVLSKHADRLQVEAVELSEAVAALLRRADKYRSQVVDLAESITDLLSPGGFGDWVLIDDQFPPLAPPEFAALRALQRYRGLEDGPPALPEEVLRTAARALPCAPEEIVDRAQAAYLHGWRENAGLYAVSGTSTS